MTGRSSQRTASHRPVLAGLRADAGVCRSASHTGSMAELFTNGDVDEIARNCISAVPPWGAESPGDSSKAVQIGPDMVQRQSCDRVVQREAMFASMYNIEVLEFQRLLCSSHRSCGLWG